MLADNGVEIVSWDQLGSDDRATLSAVFADGIFPVLTPLAVDPGHPFPYISNLSLNLAVLVHTPSRGETRFAHVKIPAAAAALGSALGDGRRWLPLEQLIAAHLHLLFPGMRIEAAYASASPATPTSPLEEAEADDLLVAVETELRRRRFGARSVWRSSTALPTPSWRCSTRS